MTRKDGEVLQKLVETILIEFAKAGLPIKDIYSCLDASAEVLHKHGAFGPFDDE